MIYWLLLNEKIGNFFFQTDSSCQIAALLTHQTECIKIILKEKMYIIRKFLKVIQRTKINRFITKMHWNFMNINII